MGFKGISEYYHRIYGILSTVGPNYQFWLIGTTRILFRGWKPLPLDKTDVFARGSGFQPRCCLT